MRYTDKNRVSRNSECRICMLIVAITGLVSKRAALQACEALFGSCKSDRAIRQRKRDNKISQKSLIRLTNTQRSLRARNIE